MLRTETARENGQLWMHELEYGAEKAFQVMNQDGLNWHKLEVTKLHVQTHLIGAEVLVEPVPGIDEPFDPFEGRLERYNPRKAVIGTRTSSGMIVTKFCHIGLNDAGVIRKIPRIELFTERRYKF